MVYPNPSLQYMTNGSVQVIDQLSETNDDMKRPVYVIGYYMMRRSTSVRGRMRFPTHAIIAPTSGLSMADLLQMAGRNYGNGRDILGEHSVVVLMVETDFNLVKTYRDFIKALFQ